MSRISIATAVVAIATLTAGCAPPAGQTPAAETEAAAPLTANGEPATLTPETEDNLQMSAGVDQIDPLANQGDAGVKLFGTVGGDPAMNGVYTYLAFYEGTAEGWRVFRLGDFLSYRVLSDSPGRVDLEIQQSTMNDATGEIGSRTYRVIVSWTAPADGTPPTEISVTPAE